MKTTTSEPHPLEGRQQILNGEIRPDDLLIFSDHAFRMGRNSVGVGLKIEDGVIMLPSGKPYRRGVELNIRIYRVMPVPSNNRDA